MKKAILCMLKSNIHDHFFYKIQMNELKKLAESLDYEIIDEVIQTRMKKKSKFLIGSGKVLEIKKLIQEKNIETVIFYNNLTSKQKINLLRSLSEEYSTEIEILDRYELTLKIFEQNATDKLSKIQIQLATLNKEFPLYKLQANIQFKKDLMPRVYGAGEFAYDSKVKSYAEKIAAIRSEIEPLKKRKLERIRKRKKILKGGKICCIVGHYNAGKTTLFNLLTGADKPISDQPFTTLSSKYRRINDKINIMLVDTIGFVIDLDPRLIKSFELNLLDMKNADIIAYLVALDDNIDLIIHKLYYGLKLLKEIDINPKCEIIIIFNKMDMISESDLDIITHELEPILSKHKNFYISAKDENSLDGLITFFENN